MMHKRHFHKIIIYQPVCVKQSKFNGTFSMRISSFVTVYPRALAWKGKRKGAFTNFVDKIIKVGGIENANGMQIFP